MIDCLACILFFISMSKIAICFFFILLLSSCKDNRVDHNAQVFKIDDINNKVFDWSSMIHIKKIIPLEATDRSLLGVAQKCLVKNDRILFLDYKMRVIYVFDLEGRFLFSIDSLGGGSEEYTELKDAVFSYDGTQILVLDHTAILAYDLENGHFVERIGFAIDSFPKFCKFINLDDNLFYFFTDSGEYTVYQYSNKTFVGVKKSKGYQLIYERFHCQQGQSCLLAPDYGCFNIDELDKGGIKSKYYIDFGSKAMPEAMLPQNSREFDKVEKEHYFKSLVEAKETNQGIYLLAVDPGSSYYNIYIDKANGEMEMGTSDRATGLVVTDVSPSSFYGLIYPDYFSEKSGLYETLKEYISEDGNPIIIEFSMN